MAEKSPPRTGPGPKKSVLLDWTEFYPLLRQLRHGRVRTRGTGELYQRFAQYLSRRQLGALVQAFRADRLHAMKHIHWLWSGLAWSCDATEYGTDGHLIIPVQDLASRYRYRPLVAHQQDGRQIAAHRRGNLAPLPGPDHRPSKPKTKCVNHFIQNLVSQLTWVAHVLEVRYVQMPMNTSILFNGALRIVFNLVLLPLLWLPITTLAQFNFATNADNTITITGYTGPAGVVTIPDMTNGYPITSIGNSAFSSKTGVTLVTVPDSITNIGDYAFAYCSGITNVTLGSNVLNIGESAFQNCARLRNIVIPDAVTNVGKLAFESCTGLTNVTLGSNVLNIGESAFGRCLKLYNIVIPDAVTSVGNLAFQSCSVLTNVTLGSNVLIIGDFAFQSCLKLRNIMIPDAVTNVGIAAFGSCTGLTNVILGTNVVTIGISAFKSCSGLTNISLGSRVLSIGNKAFAGCSSLAAFAVDVANPAFSSVNGVLFDEDQTTLIAFPGAGAGSYVVPNSVTQIREYAFSECKKLASLSLPNGLTRIGDWAFYLCSALSGIELPNSLTSIGAEAFYQTGLTNIVIPDSVTALGPGAFETTPLKSATVGSGVTGIPSGLFQNCASLANVILPDHLTYIDTYAFAQCKSLSSITIPSGVTLINSWAFNRCTGLGSIYFYGDAPTLGLGVFGGLSTITPPVVYFVPGTKGWGSTFSGFTTRYIFLPNPVILSDDVNFGAGTNGFGFTIAWATNASVVVEACTNLSSLMWQPVQTNDLSADSVYFNDPQWTNCPHRFYRVRVDF